MSAEKLYDSTGAMDLVTETDKECEALILSAIQGAFPDHKFIGEEGSAAQVRLPQADLYLFTTFHRQYADSGLRLRHRGLPLSSQTSPPGWWIP